MNELKNKKIKVLLVDDSLVIKKLYEQLISSDSRFDIIGVASNGQEAIALSEKYKPDIISMDFNMPIMDGIESTRNIMRTNPVPIIIVSSLYNQSEIEMAMNALDAGAVNIIPKIHGINNPNFKVDTRRYLNMLSYMSELKVIKRTSITKKQNITIENTIKDKDIKNFDLLIIGASAGGPEGVRTILTEVRKDFPLPIIIVQHIDANFVDGYLSWIQSFSNIPVVIGEENQKLKSGVAYLSPGNYHFVIKEIGMATLTSDKPIREHRPSVGTLFNSAAQVYGKRIIAIILSGMGNDGSLELRTLKDLGAMTYAQNENSCLIFGMPGEAIKNGGACQILSPLEIITEINNYKNY